MGLSFRQRYIILFVAAGPAVEHTVLVSVDHLWTVTSFSFAFFINTDTEKHWVAFKFSIIFFRFFSQLKVMAGAGGNCTTPFSFINCLHLLPQCSTKSWRPNISCGLICNWECARYWHQTKPPAFQVLFWLIRNFKVISILQEKIIKYRR